MDGHFSHVERDHSDRPMIPEEASGVDAAPVGEPGQDPYAQAELERRHARTELMIQRALDAGVAEA